VTVPAFTYDYSQPIDVQAAPPDAAVADPAVAKFDAARKAFGSGDYAGALRLTEEALKVLPNDATLHEFRGLVLFAVGKYDLAAGPLYSVLSVGPGWDWTTMISLYSGADVYTAQLRKLEAFVRANPRSTAGHFVLAYHYMTQGHVDPAVAQLEQVVALAPQDTLSAQLIRQFAKPGSASDASKTAAAPATTQAPVEAGKLPGKWAARPTNDTVIQLELADDAAFTWSVDSKGHVQRINGQWSLANDMLTLAQSGQGGALVGRVTWQAANRWNFRVIGAGPEDSGLSFTH
jgi:tetratricopeptide (TPR) repeat protein